MDVVDEATRAKMMARIRGKDTQPEMLVRKFLHAKGYRFRIHRKDLPGNPDIVLPKLRTCIFVHGCFWHRHLNCRYATTPKTRADFWADKFSKNVDRDLRAVEELESAGWVVLIIWECELKKPNERLRTLLEMLTSRSSERHRIEGATPSRDF